MGINKIKLLCLLILHPLLLLASESESIPSNEMFVFHKDGKVQGFLKSMVLGMNMSDLDANDRHTGVFDVQEIVTEDSIYRIPIDGIDSISFRKPSTIYQDNVKLLHKTLNEYIIRSDSNMLVMADYTPTSLLPSVGDILATFDMPETLPGGFKGIVQEISTSDEGNVLLRCEDIPLTDVVKRLYAVIAGETYMPDETEDKAMLAPNTSSSTKRFDLGPIRLSTPFDIQSLISTPIDIDNSMSITIWPVIKAVTTVVVDEENGMAVHVDAHCEYKLEETVKLSASLSYDKDLPFPGLPFYIDLGYGVRLYLESGLTLGIEGNAVQRHKFQQDFTHDFTLEYYSIDPAKSHTTSRFSLDRTDYDMEEMSGNIRAKLGTYFEVGAAWLTKEIISAGARAEVGVNLISSSYVDLSEIMKQKNNPDSYQSLRDGNSIILGGYWGVYGVGNILMWGGSIGCDFDAGSPLYEDYYIPDFKSVLADRTDETSAYVQIELAEPSFIPFSVGFTIRDTEDNIVATYSHPEKFVKDCGFMGFSHSVDGLSEDKAYIVNPTIVYAGYDYLAKPEAMLPTKSDAQVTTLSHHQSSSNPYYETVYGQVNRETEEDGTVGFEFRSDCGDSGIINVGNLSSLTSDVFTGRIYRANNREYSYRAFYRPEDASESTYGEWVSYTTPKSDLKVMTLDAGEIVNTAAVLYGNISGYERNDYIDVFFEYGEDKNLNDKESTSQASFSNQVYSNRISGLKPCTDYYYRLVAIYGKDTIPGETVHFKTIDNGIQYTQEVDLGLSVNWGSTNLNAVSPESEGGQFQWGQIIEGTQGTTYDTGERNPYMWATWDKEEMDAAYNILGEGWSLPSYSEVKELIDNCTFEYLDDEMHPLPFYVDWGVRYVKATGPNGNSILFRTGDYWIWDLLVQTDQYTDALGNVHKIYEDAGGFRIPNGIQRDEDGRIITKPEFRNYHRTSTLHIRPVKKKQ